MVTATLAGVEPTIKTSGTAAPSGGEREAAEEA
jgi:hypothetical protein